MEELVVDSGGFPGGELGNKGGRREGESVGEGDRFGEGAGGEVGCVVFFQVGTVTEGGEGGGAKVEGSGGEWEEVVGGIGVHGDEQLGVLTVVAGGGFPLNREVSRC